MKLRKKKKKSIFAFFEKIFNIRQLYIFTLFKSLITYSFAYITYIYNTDFCILEKNYSKGERKKKKINK